MDMVEMIREAGRTMLAEPRDTTVLSQMMNRLTARTLSEMYDLPDPPVTIMGTPVVIDERMPDGVVRMVHPDAPDVSLGEFHFTATPPVEG